MEPEQLLKLRHSLSHVLAMAVLQEFPQAKLGIGPAVENGFYYDFDLPRSIQPDDLSSLKHRMGKLIKQELEYKQGEVSISEAKEIFKNQPYKLELIADLEKEGEKTVGTYTLGDFTDLCKGPHLNNTSEIPEGSYDLTRTSGAYWRGSEERPMLQRIYGLAFENQEALSAYKEALELAKRNDHRVLGPQLGIYMISEDVGAGLPLWLPYGETVKYLLQEYMRRKEVERGYRYVSTPVLAHEQLYNRSGHTKYYSEDMYSFTDAEGTKFYLKPMNCPHHHAIYERLATSYRDLPLKLAEAGGTYRNELSGTLTGLIRVRGAITQNDSHIYITPQQLKKEFLEVLKLFKEVYQELGIKGYFFRLSLPDFDSNSQKYGGMRELWEKAGNTIREALTEFGVPFVEAKGEAAFYGPKVDVQLKNVTGKEDSIATSQVDILVPERMGLKYMDEEGKEQVPIIIHRAILGSYERFTAFLIEQTGGNLPFWLAPVQIRILSLSDQYGQAAQELTDLLKRAGYRTEADLSGESVGKKIRNASLLKVPLKIVVGKQEVEEKQRSGAWLLKLNWRSDYENRADLAKEVNQEELMDTLGGLNRP